ncbi:hypothetical protein IWQ47_004566 [Aquimarina sp. EL_43]|uniref:hypothetical protein n=1 Tax=unclassified Aquimarina TaxID=2627091 RepID=UPI0018C8FAA4|nr:MULTISPECIES: hypothetical protein [unclassified Aquimarina]MBG6133100.1 hypothetical protein [Aquimarina sp. EL_35]MBG6153258.1 hypothetical protein [Aquimarina sp. EL_32]MBG6171473.1 hypothetical protein [Aquimarina sp. EL_43]
MKTVIKLKKYMFVAACILMTASCEKSTVDAEAINANEKEGFMSTTGNINTIIDDTQPIIKPIMHMKFGADVSKDEASIKFDEAIAKYHSKRGPILSGRITKWYYKVTTITGTYEDSGSNHCGTNGSVRLDVSFLTDLGIITKHNIVLDNPGNDREEGSWDIYYLELDLPNPLTIDWIEVDSALIRLKGTDGWFLKEIAIVSTSGEDYTGLSSQPKLWLDSSANNLWDSFDTNGHETTNKSGRYDF